MEAVHDVDFAVLKRLGIKTIIFDIDGTLAKSCDKSASDDRILLIRKVKSYGFNVTLASNNARARASFFAEPLGVPYISRAFKPLIFRMKRTLKKHRINPKTTALIGDQIFTDVFAGNRMGMYTIFVKSMNVPTNAWRKLVCFAERTLIRFLDWDEDRLRKKNNSNI
jgi:HAD superfamily phosphatase (TIGR01668 family)